MDMQAEHGEHRVSCQGQKKLFPILMGSSSWSENYIDMRQINRRKSYFILYIWELHIYERVRDPTYMKVYRQKGKIRYICHPELRKGVGTWGFQGQEGHSQDNKRKSRYLVIRCLSCHMDGVTQIKFISGNNSFSGKILI